MKDAWRAQGAGRRSVAALLFAALAAAGAAGPDDAPKRFMPFLGRDAAVKESAEQRVLIGREAAGAPVIVLGRDLPGPRADFENAQIRTAGTVLSRYLEKITSVRCEVAVAVTASAGSLIGDGSFEEPPTVKSPNPAWPALSGEWITYLNRAGGATVSLDTATPHGGKACLTARGATSPTGLAGAYRMLKLEPGRKYKLSLWYRTKPGGKGCAWVAMPRQQPAIESALPAAPEWTLHEQIVVPSSGEASIHIGLRGGEAADNQVWFDDISISPADAAPPTGPGGPRIFLGADDDVTKSFPELARADGHGFLIATRGGDLHIVGRSGTATLFGVWFFLQNYAGLRTVMPGAIGEVYEKTAALSIPKELYVLNPGPDFLLRIWSQVGFDRASWLQDYSGTERFLYHHPWGQLLPSDKYGRTNPELYPILGGKRYIPPPGAKAGTWQPTYSDPRLVEHVLRRADEFLSANPSLMSISVSVNDGGGYSELDMTGGIKGWREHYYRVVDAVARGLAQKHPGKYAAFLSYGEAATPPDFPLSDNAMLFLFSYEGNIRETCDQWKGKVRNFGVYQWLYGAGWVIPNQWPHAVQDYLRFVRGIGGKAFKGEANIGFAQDGARMWALANLLWNADADVDAMLKDYYEHCYGREAAPAMARFFAQAETIYERRHTPAQYNLTRYRCGPYQFQQVREDDFRLMSEALAEAARAVKGEGNAVRLDYTRRCFEFAQLYWNAHSGFLAYRAAADRLNKTDADVEAMLERVSDFVRTVEAIPAYQAERLKPMPVAVCQGTEGHEYWLGEGFQWRRRLDDVAAGFTALTAERRKTQSVEQAAAWWRQTAERHSALKLFCDEQQWALLPRNALMKNLLSNGSFEQAADPDAPDQKELLERYQKWDIRNSDFNDQKVPEAACRDWAAFYRNNVSMSITRDETTAKEGKASLCVAGAGYYGGASHYFEPPRNRARYRLSFWYKTSGDCGAPMYRINFYKSWGFETASKTLPKAAEWQRVETTFTVSGPADESPLTITLFNQGPKPDGKTWFDDVRVEMISPQDAAGNGDR